MHLLLAGGAGYIGSHLAVKVLSLGHDVTVIDNFSNSHPESLRRVEMLSGKAVQLIEADLAHPESVKQVVTRLKDQGVDGAVHMAGLKSVAQSAAMPAHYYHVNINSTLSLLNILTELNAKMLVFSSSATVYGNRNKNPVIEEGALIEPANPYGRTKAIIEEVLEDIQTADSEWRIANLRYFNPVGAHNSGSIGEDPRGIPNNLFPFIAQVLAGQRDMLHIFGDDYDTPDGTGVRDYIHITDLAAGHIAALDFLKLHDGGCFETFNLGTGKAYSVLEAVNAFETISGKKVPYQIVDRRPGDVAEVYANPARATKYLGWHAAHTLNEMCEDHWRWQKQNPKGFTIS